MERKLKRRLIIIILMILILLSLTIFLIVPRKIEHAIVTKSTKTSTTVYANGKYKKIKTYGKTYSEFSVINYTYNAFKFYDFKKIPEISQRIMTKTQNQYEFETSGKTDLASKPDYYSVSEKNGIKKVTSDNVVVGKTNVKCFKDSKGKLKTFLIYPIDYENIRVVIKNTDYSSIYHKEITLKCKNKIELSSLQDNYKAELPANSTISAEKQGNSVTLTFNGITKTFKGRVYVTGNNIAFVSIKRGDPEFTPEYDGTLEITSNKNGLVLINDLDIEDYLKKVVPSEMPSYSDLEALKCQAVAARTYAISDMLKNIYAETGAYVDDSTSSQVYNNVDAEDSTNEAISETKGIVMLYQNQPIDAKYYSASCGFGVGYQDIWFTTDGKSYNLPYLRLVSFLENNKQIPKTEKDWLNFYKSKDIAAIDDSSSYYRWNLKYSKSGLEKCLNKSLKSIYKTNSSYMTIKNGKKVITLPSNLTNLKDINVVSRSKGGNITEIRFVFDNATVSVSQDYYIRSALRCSQSYTGEKNPLITKDGKSHSFLSIPSSFFSVVKDGDSFVFYGGGFGHGVGMSQYGAMELADRGMEYKDILKIYYKNVSIKNISSLN